MRGAAPRSLPTPAVGGTCAVVVFPFDRVKRVIARDKKRPSRSKGSKRLGRWKVAVAQSCRRYRLEM